MSSQTTQRIKEVARLVEQGKIKKALTTIKKCKPNTDEEKYNCLELEGVCLFNLQRYPLAKIKFEDAIKLAGTPKKRHNALNNLIAINEKLDDHPKSSRVAQAVSG